ncbi:hypothetical protein [Methanoplanus endosymbiosus]|uniref:Uncharacterized protein n=1 Tax=Methanoplanus endosymbiosus TaxID=33865 RepID=A0A9E7PNX1_9EURY|nr:hypothetical protein [Methanoplanus endosymbiosus]UUX92181.1 hypothetical protein L6E24_12605 [Methanoplanus endosymbiosus]
MKMKINFLVLTVALALLVTGVSAFDSHDLDIDVQADGSAVINYDYSLSWGESIAFALFPNKEGLLEGGLTDAFGDDAEVLDLTSEEVSFKIPGFAKVTYGNDTTYKTPSLPYDQVGSYTKKFSGNNAIIGAYIPESDSLVPDKTTITFPDGFTETYNKPYPDEKLPSVTHTV